MRMIQTFTSVYTIFDTAVMNVDTRIPIIFLPISLPTQFLSCLNLPSPSSSTFFISWNGESQGKESHSGVNIVIQDGGRVVDNFFYFLLIAFQSEWKKERERQKKEGRMKRESTNQ